MARPTIHANPKRTNVIIDRALHAAATKHAQAQGFGSFSGYVSRLLVADMERKRSRAEGAGRTEAVAAGGHA